MKRNAGFTLIELVVVIVILGILAITAAPKFINMQGDAREATLNGVKAAIQSASSMVHAKAVIAGQETTSGGKVTINGDDINTIYGYPKANSLLSVLNLSASSASSATDTDFVYSVDETTSVSTFTIWPKGDYSNVSSSCNVVYTMDSANSTAVPTIKMNKGC